MTKDEIKKALECCCNSDFKTACRNCSYLGSPRCNDTLCKDALNLITEQEKKIERLTEKLGQVLLSIDTVKEMNTMCSIDEQRKRAVQDFAEKLKEKALLHCRTINCYECKFIETTIDELLEEYKND